MSRDRYSSWAIPFNIHPPPVEVFLEGWKFQISGGGWEGEISQGVVKFSFSEGSVAVDEIF